jgi:putative NADH-flavin reductase
MFLLENACVKYRYAQEFVKDIGVVEEGEHINAIVSGNFIAGDLIEAYLVENDLIAEEIIISTLSMSRENVDSLKNIQENRLEGVMGIVISDFFFSHERKSGIEDIINSLSDGLFALAVAGIHTKLTLIKTTCGQHIVIGGSANLRSSLNIEQITIDNCPVLYAFHREWMADILNKYQATHQMLRREKLWLQVAKAEEQKKAAKESSGHPN